jgi:hypothetical protein
MTQVTNPARHIIIVSHTKSNLRLETPTDYYFSIFNSRRGGGGVGFHDKVSQDWCVKLHNTKNDACLVNRLTILLRITTGEGSHLRRS